MNTIKFIILKTVNIFKNNKGYVIIILMLLLGYNYVEYKKVVSHNELLQKGLSTPRKIKHTVKVTRTVKEYINISPERINEISRQYEIEIEKMNKLVSQLRRETTETTETDTDTTEPTIITNASGDKIQIREPKLIPHIEYNTNKIAEIGFVYKFKSLPVNIGMTYDTNKSYGIIISKTFY